MPAPDFELDKTDPRFIRRLRPLLGFFYEKYFRVGYHGIENVPQGPVLIVGNHNGMLGFEIFMILEGWLRHSPPGAAKVLALTHSYAIDHPALSWLLPRLGAMHAKHENARAAFAAGYSVLVYPGGDLDAMRPYRKRASVDFGNRRGYARLAASAGVPILPVVNVGAHEQTIIFHRSHRLAEALGFREKYRVHGIPITLRGLPFLPGLFFKPTERAAFTAMMALSAAPLPAKMDFYFEKPIALSEEQRQRLSLDEQAELLDRLTREALEARLKREYSKPRLPLLGELGAR